MEVVYRAYAAEDGAAFRRLNEAWIEELFTLEEKDRKTLNDPDTYILAKGGHIFMAILDGEAVGCCALLAMGPGAYEAAKMTVAAGHRGRGIAKGLMKYTLEQARELGATLVYLETNDTLHDAIALYERFGFRHLPPERVTPSPYARANVFMELVL